MDTLNENIFDANQAIVHRVSIHLVFTDKGQKARRVERACNCHQFLMLISVEDERP